MIIHKEIPIFLQLAEVIKGRIIGGELHHDDKIPSVRELAAEFEINNNTAMHTIDTLAKQDIIYQKRGMGYFVSENAKQIIEEQRHQRFNEEILPTLKKAMSQLGITKEELLKML